MHFIKIYSNISGSSGNGRINGVIITKGRSKFWRWFRSFFTQSAINFLSSCIYFFATFENGKYSDLPHILSFMNRSYKEIFDTLFTNEEIFSLLSPFKTSKIFGSNEKGANVLDISDISTQELKTSIITNPETRANIEIELLKRKIESEKNKHLADSAFVLRKYENF